MLTYVLWYLAGAAIYLFIDALRSAEELKKMNIYVLTMSVTLVGLFWPLVLLAQLLTVVVILAVKLHGLFTKGSK